MGSMTNKVVSNVSGVIAELKFIDAIPNKVIDEMLQAQADVIQPKIAAEGLSKFDKGYATGKTTLSMHRTKPKTYGKGDEKARKMFVTFNGTRPNGKHKTKRNAEVAFVNEYGYEHYYWGKDSGKKKPARRFIDLGIAAGENAAYDAAEAIFRKWQENEK